MSLPGFLSVQDDAVLLSIKVQPRAKRNELAGLLGSELKVRVTAPPVDSAANEAVLEFLAETLGIPPRQVTLVRGRTSTHKRIRIDGLDAIAVSARLQQTG
jgi:uncharacterized protein (TIGR00251 family)